MADYEKLTDPYGSYNFYVEIKNADSDNKAWFTEVSGLKGDVETFEIKEGGVNTHTHTFPGRVTWGPVTLKKGLDNDLTFYKWWQAIVNNDSGGNRRRDVTITLLDEDFSTVTTWTVKNAWVKSYEGPALNSGASDLAFETIVLSHDGVTES